LLRASTDAEIAVEVASRFSEDEARAPVRKLQRLVAEAQRFDFVHLGVDIDDYLDEQGELILRVRKRQSTKRPLPPARLDPRVAPSPAGEDLTRGR